jgi:hypothetical protein
VVRYWLRVAALRQTQQLMVWQLAHQRTQSNFQLQPRRSPMAWPANLARLRYLIGLITQILSRLQFSRNSLAAKFLQLFTTLKKLQSQNYEMERLSLT